MSSPTYEVADVGCTVTTVVVVVVVVVSAEAAVDGVEAAAAAVVVAVVVSGSLAVIIECLVSVSALHDFPSFIFTRCKFIQISN